MKFDPVVTFLMSPEGQEFSKKFDSEYNRMHSPGPNNTCKEIGCGGRVVRYERGLPRCDKCGKTYSSAENAPKVASGDFERKMRQRYS